MREIIEIAPHSITLDRDVVFRGQGMTEKTRITNTWRIFMTAHVDCFMTWYSRGEFYWKSP